VTTRVVGTNDVEGIVKKPTAQEAAGATIERGSGVWIPPRSRLNHEPRDAEPRLWK
jgi:hypothetical protein